METGLSHSTVLRGIRYVLQHHSSVRNFRWLLFLRLRCTSEAGLEAQIGILQNMLRQFKSVLKSFQNAVEEMKSGTLQNSPLVGLVINQMGITSIELGDTPHATRFFEDARTAMKSTVGPQLLNTLDVCTNLACTYANLGRLEEARRLLEEGVKLKEEKLGAVHPDVAEDRARLQAIITEVRHPTTYKKPWKLVEMLTSASKAFHTSNRQCN